MGEKSLAIPTQLHELLITVRIFELVLLIITYVVFTTSMIIIRRLSPDEFLADLLSIILLCVYLSAAAITELNRIMLLSPVLASLYYEVK